MSLWGAAFESWAEAIPNALNAATEARQMAPIRVAHLSRKKPGASQAGVLSGLSESPDAPLQTFLRAISEPPKLSIAPASTFYGMYAYSYVKEILNSC